MACRRKELFELGLLIFYPIFTSIPTLDEDDDEPIVVGDCDVVLKRYLRLPQVALYHASGHGRDIWYWWKQHAPDFPFLSKMARQILVAPTPSAGAERLFSGAGKMHYDLKKSTDELTLENQLLISMNFPNA